VDTLNNSLITWNLALKVQILFRGSSMRVNHTAIQDIVSLDQRNSLHSKIKQVNNQNGSQRTQKPQNCKQIDPRTAGGLLHHCSGCGPSCTRDLAQKVDLLEPELLRSANLPNGRICMILHTILRLKGPSVLDVRSLCEAR